MKKNKTKKTGKKTVHGISTLTSAEPSKKNLIIALLFILIALVSQNMKLEPHKQVRQPSSEQSMPLTATLLDKFIK